MEYYLSELFCLFICVGLLFVLNLKKNFFFWVGGKSFEKYVLHLSCFFALFYSFFK